MGSTPGGAVFVTAAGRGQNVTFLATSASIFTAADTESALWAPAPATQAIKETTVKKVRVANQTAAISTSLLQYFKKIFLQLIVISYVSQETLRSNVRKQIICHAELGRIFQLCFAPYRHLQHLKSQFIRDPSEALMEAFI